MSEQRNDNYYLELTRPDTEPKATPHVILLPAGLAPKSTNLSESLLGETAAPPRAQTQAQEANRQPQPAPEYRQKSRRRRGRGKKVLVGGINRWALAAVLVLCVLCASALGLMGGLAAGRIAQPAQPTLAALEAPSTVGMSSVYVAARGEALTPAQVAAVAADSVVEIITSTEVQVQNFGFWGFGGDSGSQTQIREGAGSGVIISADGYIITNNHVIDAADKIQVTLRNGQSYEANLVATDAKTDVAVLKITAAGLSAAVLGDSDALVVGEPAVVIGNPLGQLGGTVSSGIISALDRQIDLDGQNRNLLQTDASINQGNSGGGLFNQYGQLVGIVVAKSVNIGVEGLGFAIPVNDVRGVIDDLISFGYARGRVALGVQLVTIDNERAMNYYRVDKQGVYLARVDAGGSAEKAGLQAGDMLVSINGTEVIDGGKVVELVQELSPGDKLTVVYEREGRRYTVNIVMEEIVPEGATPATTKL